MSIQVATWWDKLRSTYWFVPTLMLTSSIALAAVAIWLDDRYSLDHLPLLAWLGQADSEGVRSVLSAVAGAMITIAGVTFSITIVALSLASQQFGPRLLFNFMRDRGNQIVLGTFVSTFVYSLIMLRATDQGQFVPTFSLTIAMALALCSVGVLIFFFHHVSSSIQADNVVTSAAIDLHQTIDRVFGESQQGMTAGGHCDVPDQVFGADGRPIGQIVADRSGYIQAVQEDSLLRIADELDIMIRLRKRAGDFMVKGEALAEVWPARPDAQNLPHRICETVFVGSKRTHTQDLEFGLDQLCEVAVRSLSTGINDPFTACMAIDRLSEVLSRLAREGIPKAGRCDDRGQLRLVTRQPTFSGMVATAFDQIRQNMWPHVSVAARMLEAFETIVVFAPDPGQHRAIERQALMVMKAAKQQVPEPEDLSDLQGRFDRLRELLHTHTHPTGD